MSGLDKEKIKKKTEKLNEFGGNIDNLGKRFLEDKKKLENEMQKVIDAKISEKDKKELLGELEAALDVLKDDYDSQVTQEMDKINKDQEKLNKETIDLADEFLQEKDSLNDARMDVTSKDTKEAAYIAGQKQEELESLEKVNRENLEARIAYMQEQQREIRVRKLSHRR